MKKYFALFLFFLISLSVYGQELDTEFLKTLPEDIRADVLDRVQDKEDLERPIYRGTQTETEVRKKPREKVLIGNIFGSDFFSTYQSTFMPINEPNLSASYILDFGDVLEIQLAGAQDSIGDYQIKRDGSVNLPEIGKLNIAGLSLNDAISLIKNKVKDTFVGVESYISLKNIRDVNVLVSGNVYNPGIYTLSGNSDMLHALAVAGGINRKGSYREINLIRDQKVIKTLDMYDILIKGFHKISFSLRTGDIIFVTPVKKIISVDGAIKIPAKYELKSDENLYDAIDYAQGITNIADLKNMYLDRVENGKVVSIPIYNINQYKEIEANDGDRIFIRNHSFRSAEILGAVLKPGAYMMSEGETIKDLLEKAGGYTDNAYPFGAVFENKDALLVNEMAKEKLYLQFVDKIITVSQQTPESNVDIGAIIQISETLKNEKANGRIVVDLDDGKDFINSIIRDGDKIVIPEKPNHVFIYGEVAFEGAIKFENFKTLDYYINKSGGLKETANTKGIFVLQPNGITEKTFIKKSLFQSSPDNELKLYPGSVIFIPRAIDSTAANRLAAQAYISILSNLGITLASLATINNNRQ